MAQLPIGSSGQPISIISGKYRLVRRLGGGSFGDIYLGEYIPTNEQVAIKFEKHGAHCPQLRHEYKVYRELQHCTGIGKVHFFGQHDCFNVMVMELLGYSLEDLFNKCGRRFSLKTVLQLADQVLERVETMHNRHLIHRDIKPANFVIGYHNTSLVHCIDFGLSKRYRHPRTLQHIPYRDGRSLTGTPRYASINNHLGIEQSRRDDLESIGYVLIYFLRGILPWQGLKAKTASKKYKMIMEKKQSVSISDLCQGCPIQFAEYLSYCRNLTFDSKPDMQYLKGLFRDLYMQNGYANSGLEWDWDRFIAPYGGLGVGGSTGLGVADEAPPKPPVPTRLLSERTPMDVDPSKSRVVGGGGVQPMQTDIVMSESKWKPQASAPLVHQSAQAVIPVAPQAVPDLTPVMMQTSEGPDDGEAHPNSPLNQLKQSLRITDDDGIAKSHKRHLSLAQQQGEGVEGGGMGNAWGDYKHHLGSRPKTAHGTRMAGRAGSTPTAYEFRGSSSSRPGTAGTPNYCRKCGKMTTGSSSTACGCGSTVPLTANHVVAGARGMMRYRRTRAATVEATPVAGDAGVTTGSRGSGTMTGGSGSKGGAGKPGVSALSGRGGTSSGGNHPGAYSTSSGGGKSSSVKQQETFFNGVWRKAKSFARPTSASNMGSRRPSIAVNSSASGGVGSQGSKQGPRPGSQSPSMYSASSGGPAARSSSKERASTAGAGGSRPAVPSSSSKHLGGFSTGLSPA